ncbi:hypothetical protein FNV43_RR20540 [Rhamnella rubrinervis]|uniref:Uncharacterized protein n=1 Tax=Rhamnella rubrinervis TaxID=2594499 RepID=A0A8K0GTH2_9ROSA|nr:hypothetical protein FNV43_RR20540 [Rhamnella rubrinervis]
MGETADEVEKKEKKEEKKEKHVNEDGKEEKKKEKKDKEGKDKEDKEGGKEKKKKNPEDKNDPAKLRQKLEKIETKLQALLAKKEEILKLINQADQVRIDLCLILFSLNPNFTMDIQPLVPTSKIEAIVPGLSTLCKCEIPSSAKVELQYLRDYVGVTGGIGLKANPIGVYNPILNVSGVIGTALFSAGTDIGFDVLAREIYKFNAGLSFNTDLLIASVNLDKLDTLEVSCHYTVSPLTKTAIAAELKHSFSANDTALTVGAQHALLPFMMVKGRISTQGKVYALIQQRLWEKLFLTLGGEVDFMDTGMVPKVGLSIALRI